MNKTGRFILYAVAAFFIFAGFYKGYGFSEIWPFGLILIGVIIAVEVITPIVIKRRNRND